jgi:hypothetical protein
MPPSRTVVSMSTILASDASSSQLAAPVPYRSMNDPAMSSRPSTQPPLRPAAPEPQNSRSTSTTSAPGARRFVASAAHSPVKPPPTTQTSARTVAVRGVIAGGAQRRSPANQ